MSLANLSIIEKDDLIRKMPKDSLQQELRQPSGNFPLYMIAARLKEVEDMEKEATARQMAEQSSQEAPTVAARLAMQAMPQGAMSSIGAMPSPQPRPDPQGQMAQQLAGPQQQMPTVRAQRGLKGAYAGDTAPIDAEMIAAAVRERQRKGDPRLYNLGRKAGFEQAGRKGATPAAQIAAMLGLPSGVARAQERAFGGKSTLPPMQVESSPLALSRKGFTSPTRGVAPKAEQPAGLDLIKMLAQLSDDGGKEELPTVFAQSGASRPDINQLMSRLAQRRIDEQGETLMSPSAASLVSQLTQAKQAQEAEVAVEERGSMIQAGAAGLGSIGNTIAGSPLFKPMSQEARDSAAAGYASFLNPIAAALRGNTEMAPSEMPTASVEPAPAMPPSREEIIARRLRSRIGAGKQPVDTSQSTSPEVMSQLAAVRGQNLDGPSVANQLLTEGPIAALIRGDREMAPEELLDSSTEAGSSAFAQALERSRNRPPTTMKKAGEEGTQEFLAMFSGKSQPEVQESLRRQIELAKTGGEDLDQTAAQVLGQQASPAADAGIASFVRGGDATLGGGGGAERLRDGITVGELGLSPELQVVSRDTAQKIAPMMVRRAAGAAPESTTVETAGVSVEGDSKTAAATTTVPAVDKYTQ